MVESLRCTCSKLECPQSSLLQFSVPFPSYFSHWQRGTLHEPRGDPWGPPDMMMCVCKTAIARCGG